MFRLKRFSQVWVSASQPYELSLTKEFPYRDTYPFFKAVYEEFRSRQLIWGTGYPKPRWELPMDQELRFVNEVLDFFTPEDRKLILGGNALGTHWGSGGADGTYGAGSSLAGGGGGAILIASSVSITVSGSMRFVVEGAAI